MDNKSIAIIILTAMVIVIASVGCYFTFFNNGNTKTMAFEEFTIEVPKNVEFQTSVSGINIINSSEGYYVAELGRNSSVSEKMFKNIASKNQDIGNIDGFNVENASGLHIYKMTQAMGNTKYIATYELNGVAILIGAPDLDNLKKMVNSIKFTNNTAVVNNTSGEDSSSSQPSVQVVKKSSASSNTSTEEDLNELTEEDLNNAYIYGYVDGYNDGNYYSPDSSSSASEPSGSSSSGSSSSDSSSSESSSSEPSSGESGSSELETQ